MKNILIVGATGSVGQVTRKLFLEQTQDQLTLFSRNAHRLHGIDENREKFFAGSVLNPTELDEAMQGQDVVFASLSGDLKKMAEAIVSSMKRVGVKKIIFIASMGIYNEIPASLGAAGNLQSSPMLQNYRDAADVIEASGLDYTVIRPGWFDSSNDTDYEVTLKGQPFGGHDVSRKSIADLVVKIAESDKLYVKESVGINRPE
ncbi:NAD(P)H-binding protein [Enterococcus sp. 669A]|uniref:NAD(P)H-binding protein n=1 Tax=Candidatus Enterococcus moelleringii TaxID=2815325 RepID=A0ABS3L8X6_9ENTE|nr:NAD(P)H-binding protein [Enterococcus sp. 669A]MBO1306067.1 NAD(P)H-binding protein [Enterococcus sp. 669A]